jgi:DnaK suppressor protein
MQSFEIHAAKLQERLSQVINELKQVATHNEATDDWEAIPENLEGSEADENAHADASEELSSRVALTTSLEQDYRNIKRALLKIENGTYGICEITSEPIEPERLLFKPDARTCHKHMNEEGSLPL